MAFQRWSQDKNLGDAWELEMPKELLWSVVWPQPCPPKDATAGCGWVRTREYSSVCLIFTGGDAASVRSPENPVLGPRRRPQSFGSWAPFWVDKRGPLAAAWHGNLNLSLLAAPHQLETGEGQWCPPGVSTLPSLVQLLHQ